MAYGFRHIPPRRVSSGHDDRDRCMICGAILSLCAVSPYHFCKEVTYGTYVALAAFLPLRSDDNEPGEAVLGHAR